MFKTDNIQSYQLEVRCSTQLDQSAYSERLIPPLVIEETPLPSNDGEGVVHKDRKHIA
jgi:hypothetical protein